MRAPGLVAFLCLLMAATPAWGASGTHRRQTPGNHGRHASGPHGRRAGRSMAGVVADIPTRGHVRSAPRARVASLGYGGGPVLHANRTHLIFWQPAGSGLAYDRGYTGLFQAFLAAVAADSRMPSNVYSLTGQYRDHRGPATYNSTYGGSVLATDRLPVSGCVEPPVTGPGWPVCLSDQQLVDELHRVIGAHHLPTGASDIYFLVLPAGIGSCMTTGPTNCALGGSTVDGSYCGYHSTDADQTVAYAVIPYNAVDGHCQSDGPRPNGSSADPTLSTLSHEHNEMVTDPYSNAWLDNQGNENGDLCIGYYGANLGGVTSSDGVGGNAWNQLIHGERYYLQQEWSNEAGGCQSRDESDSVSFASPAGMRARGRATFAGRAFDPDGSVVAYDWFFGDGGAAHRRVAAHTYRRAGFYRVVLRITDSAGNRAFFARMVGVAKGKAPDRRAHRRPGKRRASRPRPRHR